MRLESYLTEGFKPSKELEEFSYTNEKDRALVYKINEDCSTYFKSIKYGQELFRGISRGSGRVHQAEIRARRKDRRPLDTPSEVHDVLNKAFYKQFKLKARTEAIFCAPTRAQAYGFGAVYHVFPVGNFKMIYSPKIKDLYINLRKKDVILYEPSVDTERRINPDMDKKELDKIVQDNIKKYRLVSNKANAALKSDSEIMLFCEYYYLASTDFVSKYYPAIFSQTKK